MTDEILAGLDPEQRAVALAVHGPVVVLAGAGTGKTRAITHRIAHAVSTGAHEARRTLAVTFTTRAAGEMRERLRLLGVEGVQVRTFHAAALRQLRYFWPRYQSGSLPDLVASKAPLVAEAAKRCRVPTDPTTVRDLSGEIEWSKSTLIAPSQYADAATHSHRQPPVLPEEMARVYEAYEDVRAERGVLDFEEVLLLTAGLMKRYRPVQEEIAAAYRWFTVDEYQDVNPLQQRVLDLWLGDRDDLCVVGDAAQTIYSFAGASPESLLTFRQRHSNATEVRLIRCYRCSPQIVDVANRVLATAKGPAAALRLSLVSQRESGPEPRITTYDDETAEAEDVARRISALIASGVPAREIAILFRINAQSEGFEQALAAAGIAYTVRGGERFFDRPEVREAVTRIRGAARAGEVEADGRTLGAQVTAVITAMGWTAQAPSGRGAVRERWESLSALVDLADDLQRTQVCDDLAGLITELDRRAESQHAPLVDGVTLSSLHAAKGLEWQAVFLVGLTDALVPYGGDDADLEEERRLLYVGLTRAARHLELSWAQARQPGGRATRRRSRFLDEAMAAEVVAGEGATVRAGSGSRSRGERPMRRPSTCRACGKALVTGAERARGRCRTCPASLDEDLLERLKAWRLAEATHRAVPAYVIFTDATLEAVADVMPDSAEGLMAVSGIGPAKVERYGDALLAILRGEEPPSDSLSP